jgi:hypothetical protein
VSEKHWTTKEQKILAALCPTRGTRAAYEALGGRRTLRAVRLQADKWGIKKHQPSGWRGGDHPVRKLSDEDIADLRSDVRRAIRWPGMSQNKIGKALGICGQTVGYHIKCGRQLPEDE